MVSERIFIALGANLGDRERTLRAALARLAEDDEIHTLRASSFFGTEPVGGPAGQPHFLNAAAEITTELPPRALLARLHEIETEFGRERRVRNGPRTLDLDLLTYGLRVIDEPTLQIPHPRMWTRDFVMQPLREICADAHLEDVRRAVAAHQQRE